MEHASGDSVVVRRGRVVANSLNDAETVMLDVEKGTYFGVRNVGKVIWEALESPTRIDDLVSRLVADYAVDDETCRQDVLAFINNLEAEGLVDVHPAAPSG